MLDPENKDVYSIVPQETDIIGFSIDADGGKRREYSREKTARLLLQATKEATRLIELQANLSFVDRLESLEAAIRQQWG